MQNSRFSKWKEGLQELQEKDLKKKQRDFKKKQLKSKLYLKKRKGNFKCFLLQTNNLKMREETQKEQ